MMNKWQEYGKSKRKSVNNAVLTILTLDLLPGPASSVLGTLRKLLAGTNVTCHEGKPVLAEVLAVFTVGESFGKVTNDTHAGSEEGLGAVGIEVNGVEKLKDRVDVWSNELVWGSCQLTSFR